MRRNTETSEWGMLTIGLLVLGAYIGWNIYADRLKIDDTERERLATQVRIIDENLGRQLKTANNALTTLQLDIPHLLGQNDGAALLNLRLQSLSNIMPGIRTMTVMDAKGTAFASNRPALIGQNFSERSYFKIAKNENTPLVLHVSPPIKNALGAFAINLEKSLSDSQGRFSGLVMATLDPDYFSTLLGSVNYADDMWASLAHADGTLFLTVPQQEAPLGGKINHPGSLFSRHVESGLPATILVGQSVLKNEMRIAARRTVQPDSLPMDASLLVAVTRSVDAIYKPWRHNAMVQGGLFTLLALISGISLHFLQGRHRKAEQQMAALKSSEQRIQLFFERQIVGMAISSPQKGWMQFNDRLCQMLGYSHDELSNLTWADITHPEDINNDMVMFNRMLAGEIDDYTREKRYIRKDGEVIYVEISVGCVRLPDRTVDYVLGLIVDITERKHIEKACEQERIRLQTILRTASDGIHIVNRDGVLLEANDTFLHMLGYDRTAIGHLRIADWDVNDSWANIKERIDRLITHRGQSLLETRHLCRDGRILDVEISASGLEIQGNGILIAASRDITARKHAEQQLRYKEYLLSESQRIAHVGSWHYTLSGQLSWSDETYRIYDVSPDTFVPTIDNLISLLHEDDRAALQNWIVDCMSGMNPGPLEFRVITSDGSTRTLSGYGELQCDDDDLPCYLIGVVLDITERRQAEQQLRIAATAFETQEGMFISDANGIILRANQAFSQITGYSTQEIVGKTPAVLKSGRHDAAFYAAMWSSIKKTGSWHGEIWNRRKCGDVYPEWLTITAVKGANGEINNFVATLTDITLRKAAEEEIKRLAFYDPLTGLPNRRLLLDRLTQALASSRRSGQDGAVMFIDLDKFKSLNDAYGHKCGDLLLQQVGQRLLDCVRAGDSVARLGGDEFVVMLENLTPDPNLLVAQVESVGLKILSTLSRPYLIENHQHDCTSSIGVSLFSDAPDSVEDLLKQADTAMYAAKEYGRNTLLFFSPDMYARDS